MTEKVKGEWMNPLIFWNNLQFISLKSNICDSDEAKYLRKYCYDWPHTSESWGDDLMDYDATGKKICSYNLDFSRQFSDLYESMYFILLRQICKGCPDFPEAPDLALFTNKFKVTEI